jgi:hypothetical protein
MKAEKKIRILNCSVPGPHDDAYVARLLYVGSRVTRLGDFFTSWATFFFGQFFENHRSSTTFSSALFLVKIYLLILTKNVLVHILGDFVTNSSGHPGR